MTSLLHKELSYKLQGAAFDVRKQYGPGHKESLYKRAFAEELATRSISFEIEKAINIMSPRSGKVMGKYQPDLIVDGKVIVELKAIEVMHRKFVNQLYDYLRNSKYELGYLINFAAPRLYIKRIIYTNDRKFQGVV